MKLQWLLARKLLCYPLETYMRAPLLTYILLFIVGIISIIAQGILFLPGSFSFILDSLPDWGNITFGAILFIIAIFAFFAVSHTALPRASAGRHTSGTLLAIQAFTTAGIFYLLDNSASASRGTGFGISVIITILTSYGIFLSIKYFQGRSNTIPSRGGSEMDPVFIFDPGTNVNALNEQIALLTRQLVAEKRRTTQLIFLNELSQQLETELDPPVAAQLAVNTLEKAMECSLASLLMHDKERQGFIVLASAGKAANTIPPGYFQPSGTGLLGRTVRLKKTQIVHDTRLDPDYIALQNDSTLSTVDVPIILHGQVQGILEICSDTANYFTGADATIVEGVASEIMRAWERSSYHQRLTELIQAGISLTTLLDPQAAVQEVAVIARKTLEARFVFVTLLDQQGNFTRTASAGEAPVLLASLNNNPAEEPLMQAALNATKPFRVRDIRKYVSGKDLEIDNSSLRSALAIPIRLHRLSIGAIIAFGKQEGVFFSENDESLADLMSSQAAASIESSWLYQELRSKESITSLLHRLSTDVIQTEELSNAAELIAQAAHKVTNARETGIVLLTREGEVQAEVEIDTNGLHTRREHPQNMIDQAIQSGQSIIVSVENGSLVSYPLMTRSNTYGALWMNIPESRGQNYANIQMLANQASIALERSILLSDLRKQAQQLEEAFEELEITYDRTLTALMSALDARDRETEGHSARVSQLATLLGEAVGLTGLQLKALERGALLHDIGKIGISDTILHKPGKLTDEEWKIMRVHPEIGARIVESIPFLQGTMAVIRYHHERWDGSGYPLGLKDKEIPVQARIFAVVDVFDALTSKRSYRKKSSPENALQYLRDHSEKLFDPEIVEALARLPYKDFIEGEKTVL